MNQRVYIDDSKARNYLMVAGTVVPADARGLRKVVRSLILLGQHRLGMHEKRDSRRRLILAALTNAGVKATIYDDGGAERSRSISPRTPVASVPDVLGLRFLPTWHT